MKLRTTFLTMLTVFALMIGASVQAQDDMMEFDACFGLSEDDCTVINEASANGLGDAESYTLDVEIDFSGSELAGLFEFVGSFLPDLELGSIAEVNEATFTFDGTFDIVMGDEMGEGGSVSGSFTSSYSRNGGDVTEVAYDIVLLGDTLYADSGDGWQSIDLNRVAENEALSAPLEGLGLDLGMGDDMEDDMAEEDAVDAAFDVASFGALFAILDLPGFISYERAGDDFSFNIDFSVLQALLEEENEDLLNELMTSAAEIDASLAFFIPVLPTLISDGNISVIQTVDTDANIVTSTQFGTNLDLALGILSGNPAVTSISLTANLSQSNFNSLEQATAPEGAVDATDEFIDWLTGLMETMEESMEETDE